MAALDTLRRELPDYARDIKLNLERVLGDGPLTVSQRWGVAVAAAAATGHEALLHAIVSAAEAESDAGAIEDGLAAATLMAMNNVYYRFCHIVGKDSYAQRPARLRMNRLGRPTTSRTDLELMSLAVSAISGCEACVRSHEQVVLEGGLSEDHVHDAIRIASTICAAARALWLRDNDALRSTPTDAAAV